MRCNSDMSCKLEYEMWYEIKFSQTNNYFMEPVASTSHVGAVRVIAPTKLFKK